MTQARINVSARSHEPASKSAIGAAPARTPAIRRSLLHRPTPPPDAVPRSRLVEALEGDAGVGTRLVCAPAGFGKSVAVSQWCETLDQPVAWLSVDSSIDETRWFIAHLATAVRGVFPEALPVVSQLHNAAEYPSTRAVLTALSNELDDLSEPLIVFDDLQELTSSECHEIMSALLLHAPERVRFVLISRRDPPLPMSNLRGRAQLREIRAADLALQRDEIAAVSRRALGRDLSADQLDELARSTEGWPAGVRLAIQRLRHADPDTVVGTGSLDYAAQEYLVAEVLDRVPEQVRLHLSMVSLFDRFSAELCEALIGEAESNPAHMSGAEFLGWLRKHDLFIISLDGDGVWFRFHHLFARLLENWRTASGFRSESSEAALRRAAADVYQRHGMTEEAIHQYGLAGERSALVSVAAEHANRLLQEERWPEIERVLSIIPGDLVEDEPALLLLRAWLQGSGLYRQREMSSVLDQAEALVELGGSTDAASTDGLRGEIALLRGAYVSYISADFEGAITEADNAVRLLAETSGRQLAFAYATGVFAYAAAGRYREAHELADSVSGDERFAQSAYDPHSGALLPLSWMEGDLAAVERHAAHLLTLGRRFDAPGHVVRAEVYLGASTYERNQLAEAESHLRPVFDVRYASSSVFAVHAAIALSFTELALGRGSDADATTSSISQFVLDIRSEYLQPVVEAFMAELDLRQGRTAAALRWAHRTDLASVGGGFPLFYDPGPTLVEVLLSSDAEADVTRGRELLDHRLALAERRHHSLTLRLLGLRALDLATRGDEPGALDTLRTAVTMSYQSGMIRRLADLGPPLAPLLHRLDVTDDLLTHVGAILTALEPATPDTETDTAAGHDTARAVPHVAGQPTLTSRELDVLVMLAARHSNKEIARELLIAPATVKKHTVTLYDKLNVHGRQEAVAKARTLGYLPD